MSFTLFLFLYRRTCCPSCAKSIGLSLHSPFTSIQCCTNHEMCNTHKSVWLRDNCILVSCISLIIDGYSTLVRNQHVSLFVYCQTFTPASFLLLNYLLEQNNQWPTQSVPVFHTCNSFLVSFFIFLLKAHFNLLKPTGHVMHQQFDIQQLYVLPTLYLCVLYLSENKQRLVPLTA